MKLESCVVGQKNLSYSEWLTALKLKGNPSDEALNAHNRRRYWPELSCFLLEYCDFMQLTIWREGIIPFCPLYVHRYMLNIWAFRDAMPNCIVMTVTCLLETDEAFPSSLQQVARKDKDKRFIL